MSVREISIASLEIPGTIKDPEERLSTIRTHGRIYRWVLIVIAIYFGLSILTLPFAGRVWINELPVLALIQVPKTAAANAVRKDLVMPALKARGFSKGSFSPDYIAARTPALVICYGLLMGILVLVSLLRYRSQVRIQILTLVVLMATTVDFLMLLQHGATGGFMIY